MKIKFNAKTHEEFFKELNGSEEKRLADVLDECVNEYKEYLAGLFVGDDAHESNSEEIKDTILMTESPIERIFYVAAMNETRKYGFVQGGGYFSVAPQREIEFRGNKYRVDFSFSYFDGMSKVAEIFVELNGHKYHNSTKKKITDDRKRERILQDKCDRMLTFTGTEVFNDPYGCANEVLKTLRNVMRRKEIGID